MLLTELCNSKVYHQNAYYLLGLRVGMTIRKIKRRIDDLRNAGVMGDEDWRREYDKFLIGSISAPDHGLFNDLAERMQDPEFALTEAFFWFWPIGNDPDVALDAIAEGDKETAYKMWLNLSTQSSSGAIIAKHNLAVLFHYYAIDAENKRLARMRGSDTDVYLGITDQYWRTAFAYWEEVVDEDEFWDEFSSRVKRENDPRLDSNFVDNFRRHFPVSFDNINADYLIGYAEAGKIDDAKRHFTYMTETMSGSDDVDETLQLAFKPRIDKLRLLVSHCRESKVEEEGLKDVLAVLDESKHLFQMFQILLPADNRMSKDLMNDVAKTCHDRLPSYANKTDDYESALVVEKQLLELASTSSLRRAIEKSIQTLDEIVRERIEADTCWYCKSYQKNMPKKGVKIYGNLSPDLSKFGRVRYSTNEIRVPVCPSCENRFSTSSVAEYPPIKQLLATGWKFGEGPTDDEIDAVWGDIARELKGVFGRR